MKLTPEKIDEMVKDIQFLKCSIAPTLTICVLVLKNGATVTGESNVIDPANFSAEIGKEVALKAAKEKIWQLEGYALTTRAAT